MYASANERWKKSLKDLSCFDDFTKVSERNRIFQEIFALSSGPIAGLEGKIFKFLIKKIVQNRRIFENITFISTEESFPCISIDPIYVYLKIIGKTQFVANFSNLPDV